MITVAMSTAVRATRGRIWKALTDPEELIRWDERIVSLIDSANGQPESGRQLRWRYRLGTVPVTLRNSTLEVVPQERLHTASSMGLFRFDETFTLGADVNDSERTRVHLKLCAENSQPVVGGMLDRFDVRRVAAELVDRKLRAIQRWCENDD